MHRRTYDRNVSIKACWNSHRRRRKRYKAHPSQQTPTRTYNRMPKANLPTKQHKIHDQPMPAQPNKKTLKIGNGDETRAFPIFLSNPSSGSSSSSTTTSSPFETPPPTQTSITVRELTVFPAVLRVKSLPVDDHLSSSSVLPPMAMMMNMSVVTRPHRSLLPCRRSIYHCCREVLPRFVV
jgi:hypothetical protein